MCPASTKASHAISLHGQRASLSRGRLQQQFLPVGNIMRTGLILSCSQWGHCHRGLQAGCTMRRMFRLPSCIRNCTGQQPEAERRPPGDRQSLACNVEVRGSHNTMRGSSLRLPPWGQPPLLSMRALVAYFCVTRHTISRPVPLYSFTSHCQRSSD